jgi:hypothetical protein
MQVPTYLWTIETRTVNLLFSGDEIGPPGARKLCAVYFVIISPALVKDGAGTFWCTQHAHKAEIIRIDERPWEASPIKYIHWIAKLPKPQIHLPIEVLRENRGGETQSTNKRIRGIRVAWKRSAGWGPVSRWTHYGGDSTLHKKIPSSGSIFPKADDPKERSLDRRNCYRRIASDRSTQSGIQIFRQPYDSGNDVRRQESGVGPSSCHRCDAAQSNAQIQTTSANFRSRELE